MIFEDSRYVRGSKRLATVLPAVPDGRTSRKSFLKHCEKKQFEINQSQLIIIDNLKDY